MQRNKSTRTEKIILLILLVVLVAVIVWAYCVFTDTSLIKEKHSESYEQENYVKFNIDLSEINKYNVPYQELIDEDSSSYVVTVDEIDNYIKNYRETITIYYNDLETEAKANIDEYCHSLDTIESEYQITCITDTNSIIINSNFYLEELDGKTHIETEDLEFDIPVTYNQKYDEFEESYGYEGTKEEPAI